MSIEDDFYATLKFKSGEEIFAKVAASEEEGRTMLLVHNPITVCEVNSKSGSKLLELKEIKVKKTNQLKNEISTLLAK